MSVDSTESIHLIGALLRALPSEPMLEGINTRGRNAKKPDPHQLLCTDYLTRPWLESVFNQPKKTRSRIVIADEGGVGKTMNVCMFIKHLLVNGYNGSDSMGAGSLGETRCHHHCNDSFKRSGRTTKAIAPPTQTPLFAELTNSSMGNPNKIHIVSAPLLENVP